jgi:copper chaperone CopZ
MTYLEVVFPYGEAPGERELQAIDSVREVYGVQRVKFNIKERTVRVTYDASRLKQDAVAKMLRQAGVDIGESMVLA